MTIKALNRGYVQTVTGPIRPDALGRTLMHEHVLCDITPPELAVLGLPEVEITLENCFEVRYHWCKHTGNHRLVDRDVAIAELAKLKDCGGSALVELSCGGIKPDPSGLQAISRRSGIAIIMGCGYYLESFAGDGLAGRSVDELAAEMIAAVTRGAWGTDVRAGIIGEIGVSDPWSAAERAALEAAVIAQQETGAAVNVHPGREPNSPFAIVDLVRCAGGDVSRLIISHIDRTIFEAESVLRLADTGCVVEYDFFGIESSYYPFADVDLPNDGQRLRMIRALIERGHLERITLSQDICTKTRLTRWGGHGYGHLFANVIPIMRRCGFSEAEIETVFVETPRRLLTIQ